MQEYVKVTILGGYHNGQEYNLLKGLTYVQLQEIGRSVELLSKNSCYHNTTSRVHTYRKLDFVYRKDLKLHFLITSWKELEDLNIFVPNDTTPEYEETLKQVICKALNASWLTKCEGFK